MRFDNAERIIAAPHRPMNVSVVAFDPRGDIVDAWINATRVDNRTVMLNESIGLNRTRNLTVDLEEFWRNASFSSLPPGEYIFNATALDSDGHSNGTFHVSWNVTIETTLPRIHAASLSSARIPQGAFVEVFANVSDEFGMRAVTANLTGPNDRLLGNFSLRGLSTDREGNGTYALNVSGLRAPGRYDVVLYVVDNATNLNVTRFNFTVVDVTPPVLRASTIAAPAREPGVALQEAGGPLNVTVEVEDEALAEVHASIRHPSGAVTRHAMRQAGESAWYLPLSFAPLGEYVVSIEATDEEGNVGRAGPLALRILEPQPPEFSGHVPPSGGFGTARPEIRVTARDLNLAVDDPLVGARAWVALEDGPLEELIGQTRFVQGDLEVSIPAQHFVHRERVRVRVEVRDLLGAAATTEWNFTIDAEPPSTQGTVSESLPLPQGRLAVRSSALVELTGRDEDSGLAQVRVFLAPSGRSVREGAFTGPLALAAFPTFLGSGEYTLRWQGVDAAGNVEEERRILLLVDDDPPVLSATRDAARSVLTVTATDGNGVGLHEVVGYLRAGGRGFEAVRLESDRDDPHTFRWALPVQARDSLVEYYLEAMDALGNRGRLGSAESPESYVERNHPPFVELFEPVDGQVVSGVATVLWRVLDLDGDPTQTEISVRPAARANADAIARSANATGRTPWDTRGLPDGLWTVRVAARDGLEIAFSEITVRVNNTGKRVTALLPAAAESERPVRLEAAVYEPAIEVRYRVFRGHAILEAGRLADDGSQGDRQPNDGVWTATFTPAQDGDYRVEFETTLADGGIARDSANLRVATGFAELFSRNALLYAGILAAVVVALVAVLAILRYNGYL